MRVIAGTARGRRIEAPPGTRTRPITDRAKESIFNMLASLGGVVDAEVVDLYAGSGSFGIECLSRGAARVTFVDRARAAGATIEANLVRLGFTDRAVVEVAPVERVLDRLPAADLAFCDPPYGSDVWPDVLSRLDAATVVGHAEGDISLPPRWEELRRRTYGRSHVVIARRLPPPARSRPAPAPG